MVATKQRKMAENKSKAVLLQEKIVSIMRGILQARQGKWERLSAELNSISPLNILKKGYTLCWKNGHRYLVRKIREVCERDEITVSFYRGEFTCLVKKIDPDKKVISS